MAQDNSDDEPKKRQYPSSAPPPITPLRGLGGYSPATPKTPDVRKPDWPFWTKIRVVRVWQAVALSLDIDPDGMKHYPQGWMAGPGNDPIFEDRSFPNGATKIEYGKRLRLVKPEITNPTIFYLHTIIAGDAARCEIYLKDFAVWAQSIDLGDMPPELVAMAENATPRPMQVAPAESTAQREPALQNNVQTISTSTPKRSNPLAAVIDAAKKTSQNPADYHSVWAELVKLADSQNQPAPLLGFVEAEGVKYQADNGVNGVKFFTKRNLSDRMRRAK